MFHLKPCKRRQRKSSKKCRNNIKKNFRHSPAGSLPSLTMTMTYFFTSSIRMLAISVLRAVQDVILGGLKEKENVSSHWGWRPPSVSTYYNEVPSNLIICAKVVLIMLVMSTYAHIHTHTRERTHTHIHIPCPVSWWVCRLHHHHDQIAPHLW